MNAAGEMETNWYRKHFQSQLQGLICSFRDFQDKKKIMDGCTDRWMVEWMEARKR